MSIVYYLTLMLRMPDNIPIKTYLKLLAAILALISIYCLLRGIANKTFLMYYSHVVGYFYAIFAGQYFTRLALERMRSCTDFGSSPPPDDLYSNEWQGLATGSIERVLYVSSLLVNHGEFIAFWVAIKLGVQWKRWTETDIGRTMFFNTLNGNALSVMYALVGYKMISGIKYGELIFAVLVPLALIAATLCLYRYLDRYLIFRQ